MTKWQQLEWVKVKSKEHEEEIVEVVVENLIKQRENGNKTLIKLVKTDINE